MMRKINQILSIIIFPFKDLTFFEKDLLIETIQNKNLKEELYNLVIAKISSEYKIRNRDEIKLAFDKYYPLENIKSERDIYNKYLEIIKKFSTCFISTRDGKVVYKYWRNKEDESFLGPYEDLKKVEIFHNFSKMTSMDLFEVMFFVKNERDITQMYGFYSNVSLEDMQLDDTLIKGVAENHIHAGASLNFNIAWKNMMNDTNHDYIRKMKFSYGASEDFKCNSVKFIKTAIIIRLMICVFLKFRSEEQTIGEFIYEDQKKAQNDNESEKKESEIKLFFQQLECCRISNIENSTFENIINKIKQEYMLAYGDNDTDIVFDIFNEHKGIKTYGENIFLYLALKYMEKHEDITFKHYFFQYIRIKNEFYQQIVQKKQLEGLDEFEGFYHRGSGVFKGKEFYKLMLRSLFQNEYLRKVELRFGISSNEEDLKSGIRDLLTAYKDIIEEDFKKDFSSNKIPRIGLVFNFIKSKDKVQNEKCWKEFDNEREITHKRISFKEVQDKYKREIRCLKKVRNEIPYLSYFILGIDAASIENNTPVNVFAPIYEEARDSSNDVLISFDDDGNVVKNKSLAFTFHAGEDFRHIVSGLRRIDEVVEQCKFHSGDRIGHGTALGIDLKRWKDNNPIVLMPRGEYLDNLLWTWGVFAKDNGNNSKLNIYLENEIYKVSKEIFEEMNGMTTAMLYDAYLERFDEFKVDEEMKAEEEEHEEYKKIVCVRLPHKKAAIWNAEKINYAYQCKCYLKRINEPIYVSVKDIDIEIASELQKYVIEVLAKKGIIVEVNPSSNVVIGEIPEMFNSQIYSINKVDDRDFNNVLVNINSDDPMIFNTNTSNEYAYMYYGLLDKGVGKEKALQWIEKIRKCGMETSFIDDKISDERYYKYLCEVLKKLPEY